MPMNAASLRATSRNPAARGNAPDVQSGESIGYLVRYTHRAFVKKLGKELEAHGILPGQWSVLRVLWEREGYSQVQLAERMRVEKASLTDVLDSLERSALIRRVRNADDRRKLNIYLTEQGHNMKRTLLPIAAKINRKATSGMSSAEIKKLQMLLSRVIARLEA